MEPARWSASRLLVTAFVAIAVLFAVITATVMLKAREIRDSSDALVSNTMASLVLVSRMSHDLDQERLLFDAHIFESDPAAMARVEREIALLRADFASTAARYEPLATLPEERATYDRLRAGIAAARPAVEQALALSRQDRDVEARRAFLGAEPRFRAIEEDLDRLVRINERGAAESARRIQEVQREGQRTIAGLVLAGILLTAAVGVSATRTAVRRDALLREHAARIEHHNAELYAFAGRVAHDLRRPIQAAALAAVALQRGTGEQRGRALQVVERSLARMTALIDDLLTLAQMDRDHPVVACDPTAIAAALADEVRGAIERDGGTVALDLEPGCVSCAGEGLLRQALWNLVDNAMKYRRPEAPLALALWGRAALDRYVLEVRDNGAGMSVTDVAHAFDPLHRGESSREVPGTGLGLSIVKRAIEASGGHVWIRSQLDVGTTFVLELPLAPAVVGTEA
ncbi:MAG TPA: ATP-binding protein [Anaeromyxobacteraceae bacterium]|nr:ATP-binding protein [Anaeromyxobacteraceae bacterium]